MSMNSRRFPGSAVGIVTNLNDPEQMGRVKVRFPWLNDDQESFWCRVGATQAGKSRGNFIRPEIGDEVLVLFERGDINQPFIMGSLWNGQDAPPGPGNPDGKNDHKFFQSRSGHQLTFNDGDDGGNIEIHDSAGKLHTQVDVPGKHIRLTADSGKINLRAPEGAVNMECVDLVIHSTNNTTIQAGGGNTVEVKGSRTYTAPTLQQAAGDTLKIQTPSLSISCVVYSQVTGGCGVNFSSASAEISGGVEMEYRAPVTRTVSGKSKVKAKSFRTERGGPSGPLNLNCAEMKLTSRGATSFNAAGPVSLQVAQGIIEAGTMILAKDKEDGQATDPAELIEISGGSVMFNPGMSTFSVTRNLDLVVGADFHNAAPTPATGGAPFPLMPHTFANPILIDTKPTVLVSGAPIACIGSSAIGVHMPVTPVPWAPIPITFRGLLTQAIVAATLPSVMSAGSQILSMIRPNMAKADMQAMVTKGVEKLAGMTVDQGFEAAERYFTRAFPEFQNYGAFIGILMQLMPYPVANGSMTIGAHNVLAEDAPMSMGVMPFANSCSDIPIVPNASAIAICPVQVGIDAGSIIEQLVTQAVVGAAGMAMGKAANKITSKVPTKVKPGKTPKFKNERYDLDSSAGSTTPRRPQVDCDGVGHPVDPATGTLFDKQVDLELPGLLPLKIERNYNSMAVLERWGGLCGLGWRLNIEPYMTLHLEGEGRKSKAYWLLHDAELRMMRLPWLEELGEWHERPGDQLEFCRADERFWDLKDRDGITWRFEQVEEASLEARLACWFDVYGNTNHVLYDDDGHRPSGLTDTLGRQLALSYNRLGLLDQVALVDGASEIQVLRRYTYDRHGRLVETVGMSGHAHAFGYDDDDRLITEREEGGYLWRFHYDALNRVTHSYGEDLHGWVEMDYRPAAKSTLVKLADGQTRTYVHDKHGRRVQLIDPVGGVSERKYDDDGRLVEETDGEGNATKFKRDDTGRIVKVTLPNGGAHKLKYDHRGFLVEAVDPCGATTRFERDGQGDATRIRLEDGREVHQRFNAQGQLVALLDADTSEHTFTYHDHLLVSETHDGVTTTHRYDALKRIVESETEGEITRHSYDAAWRLQELTEPDGQQRHWSYTPKGEEAARFTDPRGGVWRTLVDPMDRITERVSPAGLRITTERGLNQLYSAHLDVNGVGWRYTYDGHERLIRQRGPGGETIHFTYDRGHGLTERRNGETEWRRFENDASGRPRKVKLSDGTRQTFTRDKLGRPLEAIEYPEGVLPRTKDGGPVPGERRVYMERDALGRVTAEHGGHGTIKQRFAQEQLIGLQFGPNQVQIKRDPRGNLQAVKDPKGGIWLQDGRSLIAPSKAELLEQDDTWALYDERGRPQLFYYCERDEADRTITESLVTDERKLWSHSYQFDDDGRLRDQYDEADNWLGEGLLFKKGQRLLADAHGAVEYDEQGRVTLRHTPEGAQRLAWDALDRLTEVEQPNGDVIRYSYDAFSRLVSRAEDPVYGPVRLWRFLWLENRLAGEIRPDGSHHTYIYLSTEDFTPWAVYVEREGEEEGQLYRLHADARGAIIAASDERGAVRFLADYAPRGEAKTRDRGLDVRLRLTGMWADPATGLYLNRFRWYAPEWGRYMSPDPLGVSGGFNAFVYAEHDPINRVDPLGLNTHNNKGTGGNRSLNNPEARHTPGTALKGSKPPKMKTVTTWAEAGTTPDTNPGRWVITGKANPWNFLKTGLPGPKVYTQRKFPFVRFERPKVPYSNSITTQVPADSLQWPKGFEKWKGILGQRQIKE